MNNERLTGLMDDFRLSLTPHMERAEQLTPGGWVVSCRLDGSLDRTVTRTTTGDCARRADSLRARCQPRDLRQRPRATLIRNEAELIEL
jgi:hypothetical protein